VCDTDERASRHGLPHRVAPASSATDNGIDICCRAHGVPFAACTCLACALPYPKPCQIVSKMRGSSQRLLSLAMQASREMATSARDKGRKVAVLGAAGGIGQPLSMLMKVWDDQAPLDPDSFRHPRAFAAVRCR
jgi:hypothetical protein